MTGVRKICVGSFIGAHGVRGQLRLRSFTATPEDVFSYGALGDEKGERSFEVKRVGTMKDYFVVTVKGVTDRNQAEALRGTKLFVTRDVLPKTKEREYYEVDLVGLAVRSADEKANGKIIAVHNYGAGSFLEIQPSKGASYMLPFNDTCVPDVDLDAGFVTIEVPEDWLKSEKEPE